MSNINYTVVSYSQNIQRGATLAEYANEVLNTADKYAKYWRRKKNQAYLSYEERGYKTNISSKLNFQFQIPWKIKTELHVIRCPLYQVCIQTNFPKEFF